MYNDSQTDSGWHLDKRVPISIIITVMLQFMFALWYVNRIESRVTQLEREVEHEQSYQRDRDERQDKGFSEALTQVREGMREINAKLDRLIESRQQKVP